VNYYFVQFQILERTIVYIPKIPQLWFELSDGDDLQETATRVLQAHFREAEREAEHDFQPEAFAIAGESWVSWADLDVRVDPISEEELEKEMLALFSNSQMDGANELHKVGRCLDTLFPDDLDRALLREEQVAELDRLLQHFSRRPILLVGPRSVGKTNLVHELVYRRVDRRSKRSSAKENVWWLSPQRLITGMSFVGQWENRLLAILGESQKQNHVLYFDDVISMFRAGQSRDSNLCVADLIKNALQNRQVRLLAELTPEQFQALTTRDRGFADLFHVIHVKATVADETRKIAIRSMQQLEMDNRCVFDLNVLPTATKLQQNYAPTEAFPGKLVKFLKTLAIKNRNSNRVGRPETIRQFQSYTGLAYELLDDASMLSYDGVRLRLANRIIGQKKAVDVCARIVSTTKARLNEPERPLGSLLFVGPTGVGKTECAKALCNVMFGDSERLIRIDLNQFKSPFSASTLIGTDANPEGILTSSVRQQPFSILLLDEIEKAHPDVFDILLQVLGEGRLTDSLGRTTDFSNCVVIMTSNLGTRRSEKGIGFIPGNSDHRFVKAARDFFRPEFFNRIDEIVPFEKLKRKEIAKIAKRLIQDIVSRQGLVRRQCMLNIEQSALDQIVELGYHPTLGARAMKRALEEHFAQPVAQTLAKMPFDEPTLVRVCGDHRGLKVEVKQLVQATRTRSSDRRIPAKAFGERCKKFLKRIADQVLTQRPEGEITTAGLTPQLLRYFAIDEQAARVREQLRQFDDLIFESHMPKIDGQATVPVPRKSSRSYELITSDKNLMREIFAASDIDAYIRDHQLPQSTELIDQLMQELGDEAALLENMVLSSDVDRAVVFLRSAQSSQNSSGSDGFSQLRASLADFLRQSGFETAPIKCESKLPDAGVSVLRIAGPCIDSLLNMIVGSYLHIVANGQLYLHQIGRLPQCEVDEAGEQSVIGKYLGSTQVISESENPTTVRPVVRINRNGKIFDLRSGLTSKRGAMVAEDWRRFTRRGLPLPLELESDD